jgi:hypothetical protein
MGLEICAEGTEGFPLLSLGDDEHPRLIQVHEERAVLMATPEAGFVHPDPPNVLVTHLGADFADVVVNHAPETQVVLTDDPRNGRHRHAPDEREHQGLEEEGKPLPVRAQRTSASFTPQRAQATRGTGAFR